MRGLRRAHRAEQDREPASKQTLQARSCGVGGGLRTTEARHRLNSNDSDTLPWEEYMKLDNTDLTPDDAAEKIIERFGLEVC
ncbi:MAG: hypothetical protein ACOXZM_00925 [Eubacteriales bacterium]